MTRICSTFDDRAMWMRYDEIFARMYAREPADHLACDMLPPYKPPICLFQLLLTGMRGSRPLYRGLVAPPRVLLGNMRR
jgi:hypothetical protein